MRIVFASEMATSEKELKMAKRGLIAVLLFTLFGCISATAQVTVPNVCPYQAHAKSLSCLIPDLTVTGTDQNLAGFNTAIAQVLGQLPLAAPVSGVVIGFNKKLAVPEDITENLGTILTERGNTVGKYKLFAGFTYQRFVFDTVDGSRLSNLPIVFSQAATSQQGQEVGYAQNSLAANITQYTGIVAFGLTDRIDVSVIVPFERISVSAGYNNLIKAAVPSTGCNFNSQTNVCGPSSTFSSNAVAGSASGFGDVILVAKGTIFDGERSKLAAGFETRFPTGDVFNLLGTGAYGFKPYVVFSRFSGRVTPHANLGYQWNSFSVLRLSPVTGAELRLPDTLDFSAGLDLGLIPRKLSVVADFVGQHYFDAPRITPAAAATGLTPDTTLIPGPLANTQLKSIGVTTDSYNVDNMSVGVKFSPKGNLIFSANVLLKLNDAGLRAKYVPLVGISYRF
jgi:hypothetical protein